MKAEKAILLLFLLLSLSVCCFAAGDNDAREVHERGRAALKGGQIQQAIEQFSEAIRLNPQNYRYYNDRGVAYKRNGNLDQALADYTKALEIRPGWPHALNNRGVVLMEQGHYRRAILDFTEGLKRGELKSKLYTNRGIALARLGKYREALQDFRKAVSYSPTDYRSIVEMGRSLENLGEREKAYRLYQLAQGLITDPATLRFLAKRTQALEKKVSRSPAARSSNKSSPHVSAKAPDRTITGPPQGSGKRSATVAMASDRDSSIASNLDGYEKLRRTRRKKALNNFSRASGRLFRRGMAFERNKELPKALVMFEDSLQLAKRNRDLPEAAWTMFEIGRLHTRAGDPERAIGYLKRALILFRNLKSSDEVVLALVELATASRVAGLMAKAAELYGEAAREARTRGHLALAQSLQKMRNPSATARQATAPAHAVSRQEKKETTRGAKAAGQRTRYVAKVGRGPVEWSKSGKKRVIARILENLATRKAHVFIKSHKQERIKQPAREIFSIKQSSASEPKIGDELRRLKRLAKSGDYARMIVLLEELADRYARRKKYDSVLQCFTVSLALRGELRQTKGMDKVLLSRGLLREKRQHLAAALEDLTRAAFVAKAEKNKDIRKTALVRARKLAKRMGLDSAKALHALERLWETRKNHERGSDAGILTELGALYEKASRPADALNYFERSTASIAVRCSGLLTKMGKTERADRTRKLAMGALKKLDYSRYLQMIRKPKKARSLTRKLGGI
jgi:tetratricopeptide (TPR) repeat protein